MATQIHWFPGHMKKALNEISNKIKIIDVIIELYDARAPLSSINEDLEKVIKDKKKLVILTKKDLADPFQTEKWFWAYYMPSLASTGAILYDFIHT